MAYAPLLTDPHFSAYDILVLETALNDVYQNGSQGLIKNIRKLLQGRGVSYNTKVPSSSHTKLRRLVMGGSSCSGIIVMVGGHGGQGRVLGSHSHVVVNVNCDGRATQLPSLLNIICWSECY
jgi:hypothetical protein